MSYVSIPHSEFCLFGQDCCHPLHLLVRNVSIPHSEFCLFGHDVATSPLANYGQVSIPHSEFCLFGPLETGVTECGHCAVSIPHSEFCLFGQQLQAQFVQPAPTFQFLTRNSVCSDIITTYRHGGKYEFQFLTRNSVCSDIDRRRRSLSRHKVSIPHSEFCLFGRL